MFDSGICASDLISQLKGEVDIAYPISDESYILWLNALEQLLYTELIGEQGEIETDGTAGSEIDVSALSVPSGEASVRFEDIFAVYADKTQLIKSTLASGNLFHNTYYKTKNNIGLNLKKQPKKLRIIYIVRPELKTVNNYRTLNVMLPIEFIELSKAKLRGEAYKLANEDSLSAKWINDYNVLLETFKLWLQNKQASFGL